MNDWEKSLLDIRDGYTEWRYKFTKYIDRATKFNGYRFFWEMIPMIRFVVGHSTIAWTDRDLNIFLNIPHKEVELENQRWEFIYYHECLHQMFETFKVEDSIKEKLGKCNHDVLNVASDVVINDYIKINCNLPYPTDGLMTPEYIKAKFGVDYDRKKDDQFDLYMKLKEVEDKIVDDPIVRKMREGAPMVDAKGGGGSRAPKTVKLPTSDEWKKGSKDARKAANDILEKYCKDIERLPNGKVSVGNTLKAILAAADEIKKLSKQTEHMPSAVIQVPQAESLGYVMDTAMFIGEAETKPEIDPKYKTYEQGWDYAIKDVLNKISNLAQSLMGDGKGGGSDDEGIHQEVPENDPTEESPFLPQMPNKGYYSDKKNDNKPQKGEGEGKGEKSDSDDDGGNGNVDGGEKTDKKPDEGNGGKSGGDSDKGGYDDGDGNVVGNADDIEWSPVGNGGRGTQETNEEIKRYAEDMGNMTTEDARNVIRRFARSADTALGEYAKKCSNSEEKGLRGIIVETPMHQRNVSWAEKFSDSVKNTVKQYVKRRTSEWFATYRRPSRRQGIVKDDTILKKGNMPKKNKLTITVAFYGDISTSMSALSVRNIFNYAYKLEEHIQKQYKGNAVVEDCVFDFYSFNTSVRKEHKPNVPSPSGSTMSLLDLIKKIESLSKDYMINVILTDAEMGDFPTTKIKSEMLNLPGNIVFITNNHGVVNALSPLTKVVSFGVNKKFELILVENNFNISDKDFKQV